MTVATRITVPLLSNDHIRDAAREMEWLAKDLRRIHNLQEPLSRKVIKAQYRVMLTHKSLKLAACGDNSKQIFHKAT